jgi:pimeloyl-ACP methyl ester carboxylesterase
VFTPDSRGHGRTDNPSGEISYRVLADDIAALVRALDLHKPMIAGYSDGGQVALEIGLRYPDLPRCLIVGGASASMSAPRNLLPSACRFSKTVLPKPARASCAARVIAATSLGSRLFG